MTNFKFIKTLTAGVVLASAVYTQAFAEDIGECGPNCIYKYENGTLTYSVANSEVSTPAIVNKKITDDILSGVVENVIVSDGIKEIQGDGIYSVISFYGREGGTGKLVLPKSLTNISSHSMVGLKFSSIEINSENLYLNEQSFRFENTSSPTLTLHTCKWSLSGWSTHSNTSPTTKVEHGSKLPW